MAGLLPVLPALEHAFRVDQDVGDVLDVADLVRPLAHLEERVIAGRAWVGWVEQQAVREPRPPAGRELPILSLDGVDDGRAGPGQQRGNYEADPLARARRREGHHVLRHVVAQVVTSQPSEEHAARRDPAGAPPPPTPPPPRRG